ncbi:hypothetical protein K7X08_022670 [Anisodus acutangulus]|uniref:Uncharacterized protein n=1 Tax=Anisodus acutangulus TaxID=402998 RepID=A0A9Q1MI41_9SOLA|nr:hypothetical protein K7X08_022670 [Anisodus acutangulus]
MVETHNAFQVLDEEEQGVGEAEKLSHAKEKQQQINKEEVQSSSSVKEVENIKDREERNKNPDKGTDKTNEEQIQGKIIMQESASTDMMEATSASSHTIEEVNNSEKNLQQRDVVQSKMEEEQYGDERKEQKSHQEILASEQIRHQQWLESVTRPCSRSTDTPASLIERAKDDQGKAALKKIRGVDDVEVEYKELIAARDEAKAVKHPFRNLMKAASVPPLVIAIILQVLQQFTGINAIMFNAPVLFQTMCFKRLSAVITGLVNVGSSFVSIYAVDKVEGENCSSKLVAKC